MPKHKLRKHKHKAAFCSVSSSFLFNRQKQEIMETHSELLMLHIIWAVIWSFPSPSNANRYKLLKFESQAELGIH